MKTIWFTAALSLLSFAASSADVYQLDSGHTFPRFTISHMGFSVHAGQFNETSGSFTLDKKGKGSALKVSIKTASIDTGSEKLEAHLRGAEFFDAAKYPEMTYESTAVTWTSDSTAEVQGNLTLHGVTKPVALKITSSRCDVHPFMKVMWCGFEAQARLKRSDFGISYGIPNVGDEVTISIQAEAKRDEAGGPKR